MDTIHQIQLLELIEGLFFIPVFDWPFVFQYFRRSNTCRCTVLNRSKIVVVVIVVVLVVVLVVVVVIVVVIVVVVVVVVVEVIVQ